MKRYGKVQQKRAKGDREALDWYFANHEIETKNGVAPCQFNGHPMARQEATFAHIIGRPHIAPGPGEALENGWAMCWKHHSHVDTHPAIKRQYAETGINIRTGGTLEAYG